MIENKPIPKTAIPHIVLDVLRVLVVRQVLQIDNDGIMYLKIRNNLKSSISLIHIMARLLLILFDVNLVHCELHQEVSEGGGQALETSHDKSVKQIFHLNFYPFRFSVP